ncbi:uncharacterized protein LOC130756452 isoform X2 [Actinidia eriantha]|uniref:uncharacterized protein LOC130756452 isoform X2 n=1 Tax=Actinidia eriantha TaxID=165200 RepID=UPI0025839CFF|nr:uncharacterized protein LOC130756452 isoform X2 [Actinidia eriantha]
MASLSRFIAKYCRLQPCDAVYRPSTCLLQRRLQRTLVVIGGAFGVPENGRGCLAIHSEPRSPIVALSAPILGLRLQDFLKLYAWLLQMHLLEIFQRALLVE